MLLAYRPHQSGFNLSRERDYELRCPAEHVPLKETKNDAGVPIPDVQGKDIVVIVLTTTGNTRNFQDVFSRQRLKERMIGLLSTSWMYGTRN
jgi:hypothetical protein